MGTKGTKHLQSEIKKLIDGLGWSLRQLGEAVYFSRFDDEDETEIQRMVEKVKKHLTRSTTSQEILAQYLSVIANHPEFRKTQRVIPHYASIGEFDQQFEQEMKVISQLATKLVKHS
jgi:ribosomal protein L31